VGRRSRTPHIVSMRHIVAAACGPRAHPPPATTPAHRSDNGDATIGRIA